MLNFPSLIIGIITFNRPDEIRETLYSLTQNITYAGDVTVVIADDCSPGNYLRDLESWWQQYGNQWAFKTITTTTNRG